MFTQAVVLFFFLVRFLPGFEFKVIKVSFNRLESVLIFFYSLEEFV